MRYICQDKDCGRECTDILGEKYEDGKVIPRRLPIYFTMPTGKHIVYKCPYCRGKLKKKENND